MNIEVKIIVGLSSALGIAVAGAISQNETIKKLKKDISRKEAVNQIFIDTLTAAAKSMSNDQLFVLLSKLDEDVEFYSIVREL